MAQAFVPVRSSRSVRCGLYHRADAATPCPNSSDVNRHSARPPEAHNAGFRIAARVAPGPTGPRPGQRSGCTIPILAAHQGLPKSCSVRNAGGTGCCCLCAFLHWRTIPVSKPKRNRIRSQSSVLYNASASVVTSVGAEWRAPTTAHGPQATSLWRRTYPHRQNAPRRPNSSLNPTPSCNPVDNF